MAKVSNDNKIMQLKESIQAAKNEIKTKRFQPLTNCHLAIDGESYNIHVLNEDELKMLMIKLHLYEMSATDLDIEVPEICGYSISDWMTDMRSKLDNMQATAKKNELSKAEKKLSDLLSDDKKTELEINSIMDSLKGVL